jgi:hypothetical protein
MSTSPPQDVMTIVNGLSYRVDAQEREIKRIQDQLLQYVPQRENDIKLQIIQQAVNRIEADIAESKKQLTDLNNKDTAQRESQANLQIRVLWAIVTGIATVGGLIVAGYVTHLFH